MTDMRIEDMSVTVRERGLGEVYDLALRLCARHAGGLALLALLWGLPVVGLAWTVLVLIGERHPVLGLLTWGFIHWALLPVQTAAITAYIGQAMFSRRPDMRQANALALSRIVPLLGISLLRGLASLLGGLGMLFFPIHLQECLLLERQHLGHSLIRARRLYAFYNQENIAHCLLNLVLGLLWFIIAFSGIWAVIRLMRWGAGDVQDLLVDFHPRYLWPGLLTIPPATYFAVMRFCSYIDLRTRREGWELELAMRHAAERLTGGVE